MNTNENPTIENTGTSRDADFMNHRFFFEEPPLLPAAKKKRRLFLPKAENGISKKRDLKKFFARSVCRLLAFTGVISYLGLGYMGVLYIKEKGLWSFVAEGIFGGVRTRVESVRGEEWEIPEDKPADNSAIVENALIKEEDLSCSLYGEVFNETSYDPAVPAVQSSAVTGFEKDDAVLIIHTHGTESYYFENKDAAVDNYRSKDPEKTVVAVGSAFAEILESHGIKTYHCTEMFDSESYIDAYVRSGKAVQKYMEEHPEITCVIDIHRDAVIRSDGTVVKTLAKDMAQLMIVCGTDEMGADFPGWEKNFAFGKEYQRMLFEAHPGIVRHMNLRSASFNQQLCERYLLLEVGTCGNTLPEAVAAARAGAEIFADLITG